MGNDDDDRWIDRDAAACLNLLYADLEKQTYAPERIREAVLAGVTAWLDAGVVVIQAREGITEREFGIKYFFGKMTMYPSFNRQARDMILFFLKKHFGDKEQLITPYSPLVIDTPEEELERLFVCDDFKSDYRILNTEVRKRGFNIPPLVNAYMGLSPTMRVFGTAINHEFGEVEETGIFLAVDEILEQKRMRHIDTFVKEHPDSLNLFEQLFKQKQL